MVNLSSRLHTVKERRVIAKRGEDAQTFVWEFEKLTFVVIIRTEMNQGHELGHLRCQVEELC